MKYCAKCGASLEDNAVFCTLCGQPQTVQQPSQPPTQQAESSNALEITALVTGITSIFFACCCWYIGAVLAVTAVVCAIIARKRKGAFNGMAIAGLVCAIVALVIVIAVLVLINTPSLLPAEYKEFYDKFMEEYSNQLPE